MLSYKKVIISPLLIASLLLTVSMVWIFFAMSQMIDLMAKTELVDEQRYNIVTLSNVISDAESGYRGYLLTSNITFHDAFEAGEVAIEASFEKIAKLNKHFPELVGTFSHIRKLVDSKFNLMNKGVQVQLHAGAYASHLTLLKDTGKLLMTEIKLELVKADSLLYEVRQGYQEGVKARVRATLFGSVLLILLIIGILAHSYKRTLVLFEKVLEGEAQLGSLGYQATHDALTGLVNRRGFEEHFQNTYVRTMRKLRRCAVLFMDLDGFKDVNDTYGHKVGDRLLANVGKLFSQVIRDYDFIARLGGDEFAVIVDHFESRQELTQLADRLIAVLDQPILSEYQQIRIGVSIGIATYPEDAGDIFSLLSLADGAMYQAKKQGKNRWNFVAG